MRVGAAILIATVIALAGAVGCGSSPQPVKLSRASPWRVQQAQPAGAAVNGLAFADSQHGWISGSGSGWTGVSATSDGGATWSQQELPAQAGSALGILAAVDASHVWGTCSGSGFGVARTADGGRHWQFSPVDSDLSGIAFADLSTGWVSGSAGDAAGLDSAIMASVDGGITWTRQLVVTQTVLEGVVALDPSHAWVVGSRGLVLATSNGGRTWHRYRAPAAGLRAVTFLDRRKGWAVGGLGTVVATTDGGRHWRLQHSGQIGVNGHKPILTSVSFADARNGWAVGTALQAPMKPIAVAIHTSDGGRTWHDANPGLAGGLWAVDAVDLAHVWTAGDGAVLTYR